jgi:hypothetical protein
MEGRERFHGAESVCGDRERTKHEHALKRDLTPWLRPQSETWPLQLLAL